MQMDREKEPRVIIAMKGLPCSGKSTLASMLAKTLKLSLIRLDDVRQSVVKFQKFLVQESSKKKTKEPTPDVASLARSADDLSYEAICRIIAKQLNLKPKVVVDSPLCQKSHFDQLRQVAESSNATLMIVECKPKDTYEWRRRLEKQAAIIGETEPYRPSNWEDLQKLLQDHEDYDVGDVSKLDVDTTGYFKDVGLAHAVFRLSACQFSHQKDYHEWAVKCFEPLEGEFWPVLLQTEQGRPGEGENKLEEPQNHCHVLAFSDGPNKDSNQEVTTCHECLESISSPDPVYSCSGCNNFSLHGSCAESPQVVQRPSREELPFLEPMADKYSFPETERCSSCEEADKGFSYDCLQCLFETHVRCKLLPTVVHHKFHEHPLFIVLFRLSDGFEFKCVACGQKGNHVGYACTKCFFVTHVSCAFLPHSCSVDDYHSHPLLLTQPFEQPNPEEELYCYICEDTRNPNHWMYYCEECDYSAHLDCATSNCTSTS